MSLSTTVKSIQDIMRKDAGVDGDAQRLSQLVWMLFLKIFDDSEADLEVARDSYISPIPEALRWRSWAANPEGVTGEALLSFVNNTLFPQLKELPVVGRDPRALVVREVFNDANNYMKSGTLLRQVVNKIGGIDFNVSSDRHQFGDIYEQLLKSLQSAGNAGEFYTPRAVTQFMIERVAPQLDEKFLDPACGTGGFLTGALEFMRAQIHSEEDLAVWQNSVRGVEKKQLPHLLCTTNLMLHGIEVPTNVVRGNTLEGPLRDYTDADRVDCIAANPPFGGMEEDGIEGNFPSAFRTRETADLFLVLIIHLLRDGGRGAIILHDGALSGDGVKARLKEKLLTECNLHTIVRLPAGVFAPYTGITTNLLFFTKGEPTREVWFYEHPYPTGYKSYSKTKPIRLEEFGEERSWWNNRCNTEQAWVVPVEKIRENGWDLDFRNPNKKSEFQDDPAEMLGRNEHLLSSLERTREQLKTQFISVLTTPKIKVSHSNTHISGPSKNHISSDVIATSGGAQQFVERFDLLVQSASAPKKLCDLVLQLAIRGRLVPQQESDEPADVLLKRIKHARITSGGKRRTSTPLQPVLESEAPFALPQNWSWTRLGDVFQIVGGGTPKTEEATFFSEDENSVPWLTPADLYKRDDKFISRGRRNISQQGLLNSSAQLMPPGTVLFSSRAPIGYVAIAANALSTNQGFKSCVPSIEGLSSYLYYFLKSVAPAIDAAASGTTFKEVPGKDMAMVLFALPPLAEQERIVEKIEELLTLCDRLEREGEQLRATQEKLAQALIKGIGLSSVTCASTKSQNAPHPALCFD